MPQLSTVLEVDQEFGNIGMGTLQSIAFDLSGAVGLQLDVDRSIAAFRERNRLRICNRVTGTREEDVEAAGDRVLSNEDVEDVEGDFVEEVVHYLENERSPIVAGRQGLDVLRKDELFEDVAHGGWINTQLLFLK